jgi:hypothetical protein
MRDRRGSRFQFSNADVVVLIPERLSTDVPPHPHVPARERRMVLVQPVRPLSFDRHGVQGVRPCSHHDLADPAPDCGGHRRVEMHRMSTNHFRDVRKGKVVHVIHPLAIAARTNASGVFQGVVLVLGPPPTNAITLAGVRHRHGETDGDWQSSGVLAEYLDESRCDDVLIRSSPVVAVDAPNEPWHRRYPPLMPANSLPVIRRHRRTRPGSGPRKATACSHGADCVACR